MRGDQALTLDGDWQVAQVEPSDGVCPSGPELRWFEASVPGAVHYDLRAAGVLANPYASTEAAVSTQWVADADWVYRTRFDAPAAMTEARLALVLAGVDTYSEVWLNGSSVGATGNAYRTYELELPPGLVKPAGNELLVHVKGHRRVIEPQVPEARRRLAVQGGHEARTVKSLVRRYQRATFANSSLLNLGVHVFGIGIDKPVVLRVLNDVEVTGARVTVDRVDDGEAEVRVDVSVAGELPPGARIELELFWKADPVASARATADGGLTSIGLRVPEPRLWWPRGYGEPNRYRLRTRIVAGEEVVAERDSLVGLRTVRLRQESHGRPEFRFVVNDQEIYVRGTNFVPLDYLKVHGSPADLQRSLTLIEQGNYNMVRIWGGGAVEEDSFYDRLDELGILLWQDFFLHSNMYPDYDAEFVEEFRAESRELIMSLRDRPSLAILCGGNEQQEGWDEWNWQADTDQFYGKPLAERVAGELAAELCPEIPFTFNSPHGGHSANSPVRGDTHTWGNFFNATKDPQFVTETCWSLETYSRPQTLRESMDLDVDSMQGPGWRQQWTELTGLALLTKFPYSSYHGAGSLREYLRGLEIEQAMADHEALSMLRLRNPSCTGILYWSLNKGGPLFQFGAVDYGGRPLASYYVVKRVFGELLIGAYRDIDDVRVVVSNASGTQVEAEVRVRHLDVDGQLFNEWSTPVRIAAGQTVRAIDLPGLYRQVRDRTRELVLVQLVVEAECVVSEDVLYFCPLAEVGPSLKPVRAALTRNAAGWNIEVETDGFATMICLETEGRILFSDNYFLLAPGRSRHIQVTPLEPAGEQPPVVAVGALGDPDPRTFPLT